MHQSSWNTSGCRKQFTRFVSLSVGAGMVFSGCSGSNTPPQVSKKKPNILFILADDLGYSDIGAMGSEISTPNLDSLVANGRLLTNHHTGTVSAIARSMLLSGTDHHLVGEGAMWNFGFDERQNFPGYEGYLKDSALSIAQLLKDAGYHTYMAGKWDLGQGLPGSTAIASVGKSPDQWGFERTFTLLPGAVHSHYASEPEGSTIFAENGVYVRQYQGEYSTDDWTQKLIRQIDADRGDGKPFFAFASYVAPHWPLQVDARWSDKYRGKYDQGYDVIKADRITRMKDKGIFPRSMVPFPGEPEVTTLPLGSSAYQNLVNNMDAQGIYNYGAPGITRIIASTLNNYTSSNNDSTYSRNKKVNFMSAVKSPALGYPENKDYGKGIVNKKWNTLTPDEKKVQARYMEIYAGMVENLDHNIGLLIQHLKDIGEYDNTLIVFTSDNGSDGFPFDAGLDPYAAALPFGVPGADRNYAQDALFSKLGTSNVGAPPWTGLAPGSAWPYVMYGMRWAEVSVTPLAYVKGSSGEGGISVPCIVHMPGQNSRLPNYNFFTHITDLTATFADVGGVVMPTEKAPVLKNANGVNKNAGKIIYDNRYVYPITGSSLVPILKGSNAVVHIEPFGDEAYGRAYMFSADGRWKARWIEPQGQLYDNNNDPASDRGHWRLFDMVNDRGETTDLSSTYPSMVEHLRSQWTNYMLKVNGVEPVWPHSAVPYWFTYMY